MTTTDLFLALARLAVEVLRAEDVRACWQEPSALEGYTVSGLAGHLARAVLTVDWYLDVAEPTRERELTTAAGYLVAVLGDHDPIGSDFHAAIRLRAAEAAAGGADALVTRFGDAVDRLDQRLREIDTARRRIAARNGVILTLDEYLKTRLVELVVHLDDLAVSVGRDAPPDLSEEALRVVAGVLGETAAARVGGLATIRSLARAERHPEPVRAL